MSLSTIIQGSEEGWIVFGAPGCKYCNRAKELLEREQENFLYIEVCEEQGALSSSELFQELKRVNHCNTVPQIYLDGRFIGGHGALKLHFQPPLPTLEEVRFDEDF